MAGWATVLPRFAADENGAMAKLTDSLFATLLEEDADDEWRSDFLHRIGKHRGRLSPVWQFYRLRRWCSLGVSLLPSRPALRAAACGGRPRAGSTTMGTRELAYPAPRLIGRQHGIV